MLNPDFADNDVVNAAVYILPRVSFTIPSHTHTQTYTETYTDLGTDTYRPIDLYITLMGIF